MKNDLGTVLVAVDGSKHSDKVVESACDLAKKVSAGIVLLFVSPFKEFEKEYEAYADVQNMIEADTRVQRIKRENSMAIDEYYHVIGDAILSRLETKVKAEGLGCEALFVVGNPAAKIIETAEERGAEFIVIGLHGLHGLARLRTLGSVARRVIENAARPVIVVP